MTHVNLLHPSLVPFLENEGGREGKQLLGDITRGCPAAWGRGGTPHNCGGGVSLLYSVELRVTPPVSLFLASQHLCGAGLGWREAVCWSPGRLEAPLKAQRERMREGGGRALLPYKHSGRLPWSAPEDFPLPGAGSSSAFPSQQTDAFLLSLRCHRAASVAASRLSSRHI